MISPHTFEGIGETRSTINHELSSSESLRLVEMSGENYYIAKVAHNPRPISFKLVDCGARRVVFENPDHDFPSKLDYRAVGADRLTVEVSGDAGEMFSLHFTRDKAD